jgi:hypothetical protein
MVDRCGAPDQWQPPAGRDRHVPHFGSSRAMNYSDEIMIRPKQNKIPRGIPAI